MNKNISCSIYNR